MTVTLPKDTARDLGIEPGVEMHVGYDPVHDQFVFQRDDNWSGW